MEVSRQAKLTVLALLVLQVQSAKFTPNLSAKLRVNCMNCVQG